MGKGCVLVTGGAGYIGSHAALALLDAGWRVVVVDNLATGIRRMVPAGAVFVHGDAGDPTLMTRVMRSHRCDAVMHFAGATVVPESLVDPLKYYDTNMVGACRLVAACLNAGVSRLIFSSTAAVYGDPLRLPVPEDHPLTPITPYGRSKLVTEQVLADVARASDLRAVALRYFNVAGADGQGRAGQCTPEATHLIKVACEVAVGRRASMTIFGDDYSTVDGTCVRDFIHVSDLAQAHLAALDHLMAGGGCQTLNCGYGEGLSVRRIVETTGRLAGRALPVVMGPRREGDIVAMVADAKAIRRVLGWVPRHAGDIEAIIGSALAWERRLAASAG